MIPDYCVFLVLLYTETPTVPAAYILHTCPNTRLKNNPAVRGGLNEPIQHRNTRTYKSKGSNFYFDLFLEFFIFNWLKTGPNIDVYFKFIILHLRDRISVGIDRAIDLVARSVRFKGGFGAPVCCLPLMSNSGGE